MKNSIQRVSFPLLFVLVSLLVPGGPVLADTLVLKDGREFEGKLVSESGGVVKFKTAGGVLSFPREQIDRVEQGATPADEFKERLKKLDANDIEGRLALARWCREEKLFSQRKKLLAEILKLCPDHPGVRRENGQAFRDGKWVKADDVTSPPVKAGKVGEIGETRGKVAIPAGWERKDAAKSVTATGPNNYATAPVLRLAVVAKADPAQAFPETEGWAKPEPVAAAGLSGLRSRRDYVENLIGKVEWLAVLDGSDFGVRIRLTCLECESEDYGAALAVTLDSLAFAAPPADYVNEHYGYQLNLPTPQDDWEVGDSDNQLVRSRRSGDAIDYAVLTVLSGTAGDEADAVKAFHDGMVTEMKEGGDIEKQEEITLSGEKASYVQGTHLEGGVPVRSVVILITRDKQCHVILFSSHEFGREKDGHSLKTVLDSFRFLK
jgi:hypothetical protein